MSSWASHVSFRHSRRRKRVPDQDGDDEPSPKDKQKPEMNVISKPRDVRLGRTTWPITCLQTSLFIFLSSTSPLFDLLRRACRRVCALPRPTEVCFLENRLEIWTSGSHGAMAGVAHLHFGCLEEEKTSIRRGRTTSSGLRSRRRFFLISWQGAKTPSPGKSSCSLRIPGERSRTDKRKKTRSKRKNSSRRKERLLPRRRKRRKGVDRRCLLPRLLLVVKLLPSRRRSV